MSILINLYTDGSRKGKEVTFGGWSAILEAPGQRRELHDGAYNVSNSEMELQAVINGLNNIKVNDVDVKVFSDSAYVVNCFRDKWYENWEANGWINSQKKPVENKEMWKDLLKEVRRQHSVTFFHIDGHINPNNSTKMKKYHERFNSKNGVNFTMEEFRHIVTNNNIADKLASKSAKEIMERICS